MSALEIKTVEAFDTACQQMRKFLRDRLEAKQPTGVKYEKIEGARVLTIMANDPPPVAVEVEAPAVEPDSPSPQATP